MSSQLAEIRKRLGMTQSDFAAGLGLTLRGLQDIEAGRGLERWSYVLAANWLTLAEARRRGDASLLTPANLLLVSEVVRLAEGQGVVPAKPSA